MAQIIQIKRKFTGAGVPTGLAPGELAYNNTGDKLYVGGDLNTVKGLVGSERQLEVHATSPVQTVAGGAKTFPLTLLKIPGGNVGEALTMSAADGTLAYAPIANPIQRFIGSFSGADGSVILTADAGGGTALPPVASSDGAYLICDAAGAVPPTGAPLGQYEIGDWLISNGVAWTHLFFGGISSVMAADVGVVAPVTGGVTVQAVLESLEAADVTHDTDIAANAAAIAALETADAAQDAALLNKITKPTIAPAAAFNIAVFADTTGTLAFDGGVTVQDIYDAIDLKQDITTAGDVVGPAAAINSNLAAFDTITGKLIKDSLIGMATVGDVKGQATVIAAADNIAVYNGTNQKAIKDGGVAIAALALKTDITTAQADDVKIAGSTMTGVLILSETPAAADPPLQAATKGYVDTAISSIPAAPPLVTAPELTGNGQTGTPITFTGITTDAVVGPGAFAATFSGNGLSTNALTLVCVDGGEYI